MKILFILDPLKKLNLSYDSSLAMIRTFSKRNHSCFFSHSLDLFAKNEKAFATFQKIAPRKKSLTFIIGTKKISPLSDFDVILVRKEPPFNMAYIYMTYLLELASHETLILNHPRALRDINEKFSILEFPQWIPQTLVTSNPHSIIQFHKNIKKDLILKPLDERGGRGITPLTSKMKISNQVQRIQKLTQNSKHPILVQEFIAKPSLIADKRIFLLEGKFLVAYERRFAQGDFRGNLSQGATPHTTLLSQTEKKVISKVSTWLKRKNIHFAGLDLLDGKILEINVTCPGGFPEADQLYPHLHVFEKFSKSIEKLALQKINRFTKD